MRDYISPSQITYYLGCSLKYYFRYVEEIPGEFLSAALAFGKAVHSALSVWHESAMCEQPITTETLLGVFRADFSAELVEEVRFGKNESTESMTELGQALLLEYAKTCCFEVEGVEQSFKIPLIDPDSGEVLLDKPLHGIYDLLTPDGIVEFKTSRAAPNPDLYDRHLQISAYAYAYRQERGQLPQIKLVSLLKQKKPRVEVTEVNRNENDLKWFVRCAEAVSGGIETGVFAPNPGWQCANCEYRTACKEWPSRFSETLTKRRIKNVRTGSYDRAS